MFGVKKSRLHSSELTTALSQPRADIASGIVLTAISWLLSRFVVSIAWGPARNPFGINPTSWIRWDSTNYLSIATHGVTFGYCGSPQFSKQPNPLHDTWCGTAGWLPGYPLLMRAVHAIGIPLQDAGLLISWIAMATAIFLVWLGWGRDLPSGRALVLLLLFGLFPGAVYNFALFPTSVALACVVGAVLAASRERFLLAATLLTFAGLCYPTAWFAAVGLGVGIAIAAIPLGNRAVIHRVLWGLAGLSSLVLLPFFEAGRPNAYFLIQSQPGALNSGFPGRDFLKLIFTQRLDSQPFIGRFYGVILAVQSLIACLLGAAAAWVTALAWRQKDRDVSNLYPALVGITVVLGILFFSSGAWNRSVVLAAPCVVCLRRAPMRWLCTALVVVGLTTALISRSFFSNSLV